MESYPFLYPMITYDELSGWRTFISDSPDFPPNSGYVVQMIFIKHFDLALLIHTGQFLKLDEKKSAYDFFYPGFDGSWIHLKS